MLLRISYLGLSFVTTYILWLIGNYAITRSVSDEKLKTRKQITLLLGLVFWQVYIFAIASTGILTNFSFPPRFVLFTILPAFLFTGIFLFRNRKQQWIQLIPPAWLTAYQTFRIFIETIFVATVAAGLLHKNVTIEGYNYDMVFAATAPLVALLVHRSSTLPKKLLIVWNILGLAVIAVIIFLFISTIYFPEIYGSNVASFPKEFGLYPYALVPGFLMPSAVFIHVLALVQLSNKPRLL